jgi:hypothetical protein
LAQDGGDVLHLRCDPRSCKNGTTAEIDTAKATFASGECELALGQPLHIGDNPLALHIDRPGLGRDEVVRLVVPVAFRIRADVSGMTGAKPEIVVRVAALPGSEVSVDGKALTLDPSGIATYAIDETASTTGPADESRTVAVQVPYSIATAGATPQQGSVAARVAVAPLRVDAPGSRATVAADHILIAGRAAKGATVTLDGTNIAVGPDGAFEAEAALSALGDRVVQVQSATTALTSRTVNVEVKRVKSLADEAAALERQHSDGYDAMEAGLPASVGQPIVVEGEILETRTATHRSVLLVDDRRGCAKGPCLARVTLGQDVTLPRGSPVRAYGRVAPPFAAPTGQTVLEIDADFLLPSNPPKR